MTKCNLQNPFEDAIKNEIPNFTEIADKFKPQMEKILIEVTSKNIKNLGSDYIEELDQVFKEDISTKKDYFFSEYGAYVVKNRKFKVFIALIILIVINIFNYFFFNHGVSSEPISVWYEYIYRASMLTFGVYSLITFTKKWH